MVFLLPHFGVTSDDKPKTSIDPAIVLSAKWIHPHRITGRDCDHCNLDCTFVARSPASARGRSPLPMHEQLKANWIGISESP
jgi:hypothetical protein